MPEKRLVQEVKSINGTLRSPSKADIFQIQDSRNGIGNDLMNSSFEIKGIEVLNDMDQVLDAQYPKKSKSYTSTLKSNRYPHPSKNIKVQFIKTIKIQLNLRFL